MRQHWRWFAIAPALLLLPAVIALESARSPLAEPVAVLWGVSCWATLGVALHTAITGRHL